MKTTTKGLTGTFRSFSDIYEQTRKQIADWLEKREPRERYLILGALLIGALMGVEMIYTTTTVLFTEQRSRLTEVQNNMQQISVLLHNYNRSERARKVAEQRFASAGVPSAILAHIEGVIKRKARIADGTFRISKRGEEHPIGDEFLRLPFTVSFTRVTLEEFATFLKEISTDKERPAILSRISVTSRGSSIQAEVSLDLVAKKA